MHFTGERMTTEYSSYGSIEHLHRYAILRDLLREDMVVMDIACGEGYGTGLISEWVRKVIGVDISSEAIEHASAKYKKPNIEFIGASANNIPVRNNTADLIVSFETLEHLEDQDETLTEFKRILKKEGLLILSTPVRGYYSIEDPNPFHVKELSFSELRDLLSRHFTNTLFLFQKLVHSSMIFSAETGEAFGFYKGDFTKIEYSQEVNEPEFVIALASDFSLRKSLISSSLFDACGIFRREYSDYLETKNKYISIVANRKFRLFNRILKIFGAGLIQN